MAEPIKFPKKAKPDMPKKPTTAKSASQQSSAAPKSGRGREAVEYVLIEATCELLAEIGPKAMSVRDIATRAGVNHGQIHHYFGGKTGLIRAAMRQMSREHLAHSIERGDGEVNPPPLSLMQDQQYLQSVVRLVLDGEMDLATMEIDDGVSVPRRMLKTAIEGLTPGQSELDLKAAFATVMAVELAWGALEPYLMAQIDVVPDQEEEILGRVKRITSSLPTLLGLEDWRVPQAQDEDD